MKIDGFLLRQLFLAISLAACTDQDASEKAADIATSDRGTIEAANSRPSDAAQDQCAVSVRSEVDRRSFASGLGDPGPSEARLEILRGEAEVLFKTVAGEMCASGQIDPASLAPIRRLLIQYGGGADNTAIYTDPEMHEADVLVFQYVFAAGDEAGTLSVPAGEDLRDGLLCHFRPEANEAMCAERMP